MRLISERTIAFKTGAKIIVRTAEVDDAASVLQLFRAVCAELEYVVSTPEELDMTQEDERERLREHYDGPGKIAIAAEESGRLVGILFCETGPRKRLQHRAVFNMSVSKERRSRGVGSALLEALVTWAEEHTEIEKLCLSVLATNQRAIGLYKKFGFVEEGRRPREIKLGPGEYIDDILMYRFV